MQQHITEHTWQRQKKCASVWGLHTNMVDDFGLLGCDKASYPTVTQYKKSPFEIDHMTILTNGAHTDIDKYKY